MRTGLALSLMLAAGSAWSQASSGAAPRRTSPPPESLSVPSQTGGVGDSVITARVKMALMRADNLDSGDVHVTTNGGAVKLTGHVSSAAQKQKASDVVQGLDGVTSVENDLAVGGAQK
jgi:hypothetical protein